MCVASIFFFCWNDQTGRWWSLQAVFLWVISCWEKHLFCVIRVCVTQLDVNVVFYRNWRFFALYLYGCDRMWGYLRPRTDGLIVSPVMFGCDMSPLKNIYLLYRSLRTFVFCRVKEFISVCFFLAGFGWWLVWTWSLSVSTYFGQEHKNEVISLFARVASRYLF